MLRGGEIRRGRGRPRKYPLPQPAPQQPEVSSAQDPSEEDVSMVGEEEEESAATVFLARPRGPAPRGRPPGPTPGRMVHRPPGPGQYRPRPAGLHPGRGYPRPPGPPRGRGGPGQPRPQQLFVRSTAPRPQQLRRPPQGQPPAPQHQRRPPPREYDIVWDDPFNDVCITEPESRQRAARQPDEGSQPEAEPETTQPEPEDEIYVVRREEEEDDDDKDPDLSPKNDDADDDVDDDGDDSEPERYVNRSTGRHRGGASPVPVAVVPMDGVPIRNMANAPPMRRPQPPPPRPPIERSMPPPPVARKRPAAPQAARGRPAKRGTARPGPRPAAQPIHKPHASGAAPRYTGGQDEDYPPEEDDYQDGEDSVENDQQSGTSYNDNASGSQNVDFNQQNQQFQNQTAQPSPGFYMPQQNPMYQQPMFGVNNQQQQQSNVGGQPQNSPHVPGTQGQNSQQMPGNQNSQQQQSQGMVPQQQGQGMAQQQGGQGMVQQQGQGATQQQGQGMAQQQGAQGMAQQQGQGMAQQQNQGIAQQGMAQQQGGYNQQFPMQYPGAYGMPGQYPAFPGANYNLGGPQGAYRPPYPSPFQQPGFPVSGNHGNYPSSQSFNSPAQPSGSQGNLVNLFNTPAASSSRGAADLGFDLSDDEEDETLFGNLFSQENASVDHVKRVYQKMKASAQAMKSLLTSMSRRPSQQAPGQSQRPPRVSSTGSDSSAQSSSAPSLETDGTWSLPQICTKHYVCQNALHQHLLSMDRKQHPFKCDLCTIRFNCVQEQYAHNQVQHPIDNFFSPFGSPAHEKSTPENGPSQGTPSTSTVATGSQQGQGSQVNKDTTDVVASAEGTRGEDTEGSSPPRKKVKYNCQICDKPCKDLKGVKTHMTRTHNVPYQEHTRLDAHLRAKQELTAAAEDTSSPSAMDTTLDDEEDDNEAPPEGGSDEETPDVVENDYRGVHCRICGKNCKTGAGRVTHERSVHLILSKHACDNCGKRFGHWQLLKKHKLQCAVGKTGEGQGTSSEGQDTGSEIEMLAEGEKQDEGVVCHVCGKDCGSVSERCKHVRTTHGMNCDKCGKHFGRRKMLHKHRRRCVGKPAEEANAKVAEAEVMSPTRSTVRRTASAVAEIAIAESTRRRSSTPNAERRKEGDPPPAVEAAVEKSVSEDDAMHVSIAESVKRKKITISQPCHVCFQIFPSRDALTCHLADVHDIRDMFSCDKCDRLFSMKRVFDLHVASCQMENTSITHTQPERQTKSASNKDTTSTVTSSGACAQEAGGEAFPCNMCQETFSARSKMTTHQHVTHGVYFKYKCNKCDGAFLSSKEYHQHMEECSVTITLVTSANQSPVVKLTRLDPLYIDKRVSVETPPHVVSLDIERNESGRIKCTFAECSKAFKFVSQYKTHMAGVHKKKALCCSHCYKTFTSVTEYRSHMKTCADRPAVTEKKSTTSALSQADVPTAPEKTPAVTAPSPSNGDECPTCGKTDKNPYRLRQHMKTCSGHTCKTCGEKFLTRTALNIHLKSHKVETQDTVPMVNNDGDEPDNDFGPVDDFSDDDDGGPIDDVTMDDTEQETPGVENQESITEGQAPEPEVSQPIASAYQNQRVKSSKLQVEKHCKICDVRFPTTTGLKHHSIKVHGVRYEYKCDGCSQVFYQAKELSQHASGCESRAQVEQPMEEVPIMEGVVIKQEPGTFEGDGVPVLESGEQLKHKCAVCDVRISTSLALKAHMIKAHGIKQLKHSFTCRFCPMKFPRVADRVAHMKSCAAAGRKAFRVKPTKAGTLLFKSLQKNAKSSMTCDVCGNSFKNSAGLNIHLARYHRVKLLYRCPLGTHGCGRKFRTKEDLAQHKAVCKRVTGVAPPTSSMEETPGGDAGDDGGDLDEADAEKQRKKLEEMHESFLSPAEMVDDGDTKFECTLCNMTFSTRVGERQHKTKMHGINFKCTMCKKKYKNEEQLAKHVEKVHSGVTDAGSQESRSEVSCQVCEQKCPNVRSLRMHLKEEHDKKYLYHCHVCGFGCDEKAEVRKHSMSCENVTPPKLKVKDGRGRKPGKVAAKVGSGLKRPRLSDAEKIERTTCKLCGRKTRNVTELMWHMRRHTGEKPYSCTHCDKRFYQSNEMLLHLRTKHGVDTKKTAEARKFSQVCDCCNKVFRTATEYELHLREKTGKIMFSCGVCERTYLTRDQLDLHMTTHEEGSFDPAAVTEYRCTTCNNTFPSKNKLMRHAKKCKAEAKEAQLQIKMEPSDMYQCASCSDSFITQEDLVEHAKNHLEPVDNEIDVGADRDSTVNTASYATLPAPQLQEVVPESSEELNLAKISALGTNFENSTQPERGDLAPDSSTAHPVTGGTEEESGADKTGDTTQEGDSSLDENTEPIPVEVFVVPESAVLAAQTADDNVSGSENEEADDNGEAPGPAGDDVTGEDETDVTANDETDVTGNDETDVTGNDETDVTGNDETDVTGNDETDVTDNDEKITEQPHPSDLPSISVTKPLTFDSTLDDVQVDVDKLTGEESEQTAQEDTAPDAGQEDTAPDAAQEDTAPDAAQEDTAPDAAQEDTAPDAGQEDTAPDAAQDWESPESPADPYGTDLAE